jgi:hypothetical protein
MILARVAESKFRELRTDEDLLPHGRTSTSNAGGGRRVEHHEIDARCSGLSGLGQR